jgi:glycosyltransferase involved in cell wall biosynthesis
VPTILPEGAHLLLLGHSELVSEQSLALIRKEYPKMRIAMWYVDALYKAPQFFGKLNYLDAFFATGAGYELETLKEATDGKVCFFPNVCDLGIDTFSAYFNKNNAYDLIFAGSSSGAERRKFVLDLKDRLSDTRFGIFGDSKDTKKINIDYLKLLGNASMGLNYSRHNDQPLYTSDRQIQLAANGVMVFCPEIPGFRDLFSDKEQVYFEGVDDLVDKVEFYLANEDERREIAKMGQFRAHQSFNSTRVCRFMLEAIEGQGFSEKYEWLSYC